VVAAGAEEKVYQFIGCSYSAASTEVEIDVPWLFGAAVTFPLERTGYDDSPTCPSPKREHRPGY